MTGFRIVGKAWTAQKEQHFCGCPWCEGHDEYTKKVVDVDTIIDALDEVDAQKNALEEVGGKQWEGEPEVYTARPGEIIRTRSEEIEALASWRCAVKDWMREAA